MRDRILARICTWSLILLSAACGSSDSASEERRLMTAVARTDDDARCSKLTVEQCQSDEYCAPIYGRPVDSQTKCPGTRRAAACRARDIGCGDALTPALDSSDSCWLFDSCAPIGWEIHSAASQACNSGSKPSAATCP